MNLIETHMFNEASFPVAIIIDSDPEFKEELWNSLNKIMGFDLTPSTSHNSQTVGLG